MPNSKAKKLNFIGDGKQPVLNLSDDLPKIYSDFKTVDKINAPYLNDMVCPLYVKSHENIEYIYDKENNRYNINNGILYRNGEILTEISDAGFSKEDITEDFKDYEAFDVSNDNKIAYVSVNTDYSVDYYYDNTKLYSSGKPVFSSGIVIGSRIRILDDGAIIGVVVFRASDERFYYNIFSKNAGGQTGQWKAFKFKSVYIKTANHSSNNEQPSEYEVRHVNPIINICKINNITNAYGVSILPYRGTVNPQNHNGFYSLIIQNTNIKTIYDDISPNLGSVKSENVSTAYSKSFSVQINRTSNSSTLKAIYDTQTGSFYEYNETTKTKGPAISFPAGIQPTSLGYVVIIDSITYNVYSYTKYVVGATVNVIDQGPDSASSTFTANGQTSPTGTALSFTMDTFNVFDSIIINNISATYRSNTFDIPTTYWSNNTRFFTTVTTTSTTNITTANAPNVFLDDGKMVACFSGRAWDLLSSSAIYITETGYMSSIGSTTYDWTSVEQFMPQNNNKSYTQYAYISASRAFQQNFYVNTGLLSGSISDKDEDTNKDHSFATYSNTNCSDIRFNPGTRFGIGALTTYVDSDNKNANTLYPNVGYRTSLGNGWNLLINPLNGAFFSVGISYSESVDLIGTLLCDWLKLSDSFYIIARKDFIIFKDSFNRVYKISKTDRATMKAILDNRYIIINTTSYYNAYDSQNKRLTHYATDYNARAIAGDANIYDVEWTKAKLMLNRYFMTGINSIILDSNEIIDDNDRMPSWTLPIQKLDLCDVKQDVKAFRSEIPYQKNAYIKGISVYYGNDDLDPGYYQYTITVQGNTQTTFNNPRYVGTTYPVSSENSYYAYGSPSLLAEYINGIGVNDYVKTDQAAYPLRIYNSNQVVLSYNILSQLQNVDAFFILQGQYYGVIDNKIFSVTYYGGQISEIGTIVDITGFKFIGNTPTIAFFWSDKMRAIYSFTGDANMQLIWSASKIVNIKGDFYYDESTHSIYIPSSEGLIVIAEQNVYLLEDYKNTTNVQFTEKEIHIIDDGNTYDMRYYKINDDYKVLPVRIETGFYGTEDKEVISIDRWSLMLYNKLDVLEGEIKLSTTTLTDCLLNSEEKVLKVDPTMWSKSKDGDYIMYINYNPKLIKAQGVKLSIECPWPIAAITPHVADSSQDTLTKNMR